MHHLNYWHYGTVTHLWSSDGAVDSNLLISSDTERSDSVAGFGEHRGLPGQ